MKICRLEVTDRYIGLKLLVTGLISLVWLLPWTDQVKVPPNRPSLAGTGSKKYIYIYSKKSSNKQPKGFATQSHGEELNDEDRTSEEDKEELVIHSVIKKSNSSRREKKPSNGVLGLNSQTMQPKELATMAGM